MTRNLTEKQKKYLRGLAHARDPVVLIGQGGLSPAITGELDDRAGRSRAGEGPRARRRSRAARQHLRGAGTADEQRARPAHRQRRRVLPPAQGQAAHHPAGRLNRSTSDQRAERSRDEQHCREAVQHPEAAHVVGGARRGHHGREHELAHERRGGSRSDQPRRPEPRSERACARAAQANSSQRARRRRARSRSGTACRRARPARVTVVSTANAAGAAMRADRPQAAGPEQSGATAASLRHTYFTATISYVRVPFGATTSTMSPCDLPTSARAIGEDTEIRPLLMSASASPTIW